jgi:hypothetical protein
MMIRKNFLALAIWMIGALAVAATATVMSVQVEVARR